MGTILDIINKFLERTPLFPAAALSVLTIVIMRHYGYLANLREEASWLHMFGIICGYVSLVTWAHSIWKNWRRRIIAPISRYLNRNTLLTKLQILTPRQRHYLAWIKHSGSRHFQAWDLDETISALRNMGIIVAHEHTDHCHSRYEVPGFVWNALPAPTPEQIRLFGGISPWDRALRGNRV